MKKKVLDYRVYKATCLRADGVEKLGDLENMTTLT